MKTLFVDRWNAETLGVSDVIPLFSSINEELPWAITIEEYQRLTKAITDFSDALATMISDQGYPDISASPKAKMKIIRPLLGATAYVLLDRMFRVVKFAQMNDLQGLQLPTVYPLPPLLRKIELYAHSRDNWTFNQAIINHFLKDLPQKEIKGLEQCFPLTSYQFKHWGFNTGFSEKPESEKPSGLGLKRHLRRFVKQQQRRFKDTFEDKSEKILASRLSSGHHTLPFIKKGLHLPQGPVDLCDPLDSEDYFKQSQFNLNLRKTLEQHFETPVSNLCDAFYQSMNVKGKDHISKSLNHLFWKLLPVSALESSKKMYKAALDSVSKYKSKVYLTCFSASDETGCYTNAAATEQGFTILGLQHSGRGGYLANDPLIAEENIACTDAYITSGWTNKEEHLPHSNLIPLSSPGYSYKKEIYSAKSTNDSSMKVLFPLGEMYRYPVVYDGAYYIDTFKTWAETVDAVIEHLVGEGVEVLIKNYSFTAMEIIDPFLQKWQDKYKDKLSIIRDFTPGIAIRYFDQAAATLWDIPGGGFVDGLVLNKPTFSIIGDNLMRFQPESQMVMNGLKKQGLLNDNPEQLAKAVKSALLDGDWWHDGQRQLAIKEFLEAFVKTDDNWVNEWTQFLEKAKEGRTPV